MEEHGVPRDESERAFNCGVGMVAAVAPEVADAAVAQLTTAGVPAWIAGSIRRRADADAPAARLVNSYR
jgi:phosphoribosylformylglycinamidine cyclo-ligase